MIRTVAVRARACSGPWWLVPALTLAGCTARTEPPAVEEAFVSRRSVSLRSELSANSPIVANLGLDDRVEVVGRRRRLVRIQTVRGVEGWARDDELVSREVRDLMEQARRKTVSYSSQGVVRAFDRLNVHLEPDLTSASVYQLDKDEGAEALRRRLVERGSAAAKAGAADDWYLVRLSTGNVGWVLARRVYSGIPDEIAQYAERRRIISYAALDAVEDKRHGVTKTTWLWTQVGGSKQPYDFDRFRVFMWSSRRNAYQTVKLRTGLRGYLPVEVHERIESKHGAGAGFSLTLEREGRRFVRTYVHVGQRVYEISERPAPEATPPLILEREAPAPPPPPPNLVDQLLSWWRASA